MFQIKDKLDDIETKLMNRQHENLLNEIEALKKKTEQNQEMARDAQEAATSSALNAIDTAKVRLQTHKHTDYRHTKTGRQRGSLCV